MQNRIQCSPCLSPEGLKGAQKRMDSFCILRSEKNPAPSMALSLKCDPLFWKLDVVERDEERHWLPVLRCVHNAQGLSR